MTSNSKDQPKTNSRTIKGIWIRPGRQLSLCLILSLGFLIQGALLLTILKNFNWHIDTLRAMGSVDGMTLALFTSNVVPWIRIAAVGSVVFAMAGLAVGVILGHRVFGPMVPIRAHLKKLIDGQYGSRVKVRTSDEFHELVLDLNVLAEILENKKKN